MSPLKLCVAALVLACVCSSASAFVLYFEDFESYGVGTVLHEVNGWEGWYGAAGAASSVSDKYAFSGTQSTEVNGSADEVQVFDLNLKAVTSMSFGVEGAGSGMILVDDMGLYRDAPDGSGL